MTPLRPASLRRSAPEPVRPVRTAHTAVSLASSLAAEPGLVLLESAGPSADPLASRFSIVAARPFLTFRSCGSRCETRLPGSARPILQFGNPWNLLETLVARFEILDSPDLQLPLGGCFGFWGYGLKRFVEPCLGNRAPRDLDLPDTHLGFYGSLVIFDHQLGSASVVATGLAPDGSRCPRRARREHAFWMRLLETNPPPPSPAPPALASPAPPAPCSSTFDRPAFLHAVAQAQTLIRSGDIYQVNLSQRLTVPTTAAPWDLYRALSPAAAAPYSAFLHCGDFHLASCSPELFLRLSGPAVLTRPIKGSRPASAHPPEDRRLAGELSSSPKERAELVMITDLLRNDLGRICEFGSVQVPQLARLERHSYVQHLVATVQGRLRPHLSHTAALAACFPGGSVTGAPKIRAMEIIEQLEPVARGPYTGALGYLGFNRQSQLNILIRTAVLLPGAAHYGTGAGIVADSDPEAEYHETLVKARFFLQTLRGQP